jgi:hypothetical protein
MGRHPRAAGARVYRASGSRRSKRKQFRAPLGAQINGNGAFAAAFRGASNDGTRVWFETKEQLSGIGDTDTAKDVFVRSGDKTKRVSMGQINGNGAFDAAFVGASSDGSRVFFETAEQLVAADTDSAKDLYERSTASGTTETKLVSAVQINGNGSFPASFRGTYGTQVFFHTGEQLVPDDTDARWS